MNTWMALYEGHSSLRDLHAQMFEELKGPLRRLTTLRDGQDKRYCDAFAPFKLQRSEPDLRGLIVVWVAEGTARHLELRSLPKLRDAKLTVQGLMSAEGARIVKFSAAISGKLARGGEWTAAVHLESEEKQPHQPDWRGDWRGSGACSHAALHCHVGPDKSLAPEVRVPLPAVGPADALDWLLATVVPGFEPVPWADVKAIFDKAKMT